MKKILVTIAMLAIAGPAMAAGLIGDCYDCHTMHNSENGGQAVALEGAGATVPSGNAIPNLLKFDCIACHASDPNGADKIWAFTGASGGGSMIPQVAHADTSGDLAGGNFSYGLGANGTNDKVHNVIELFDGQFETVAQNGNPPGMFDTTDHDGIFTGTNNFDQFSCAGARGCHGTRNQLLTDDGNGTTTQRTGMAAIAGAHHVNTEGAKGAAADTNYALGEIHDGQTVADGYRMIPGLKGFGNGVLDPSLRWQNISAGSHNEYYGDAGGFPSGCGACHTGSAPGPTTTTTMQVPNGSMSGFCSTCHGNFHSSGIGADADGIDNGTSTAFLRHPSDYILTSGNGSDEYAAYTTYDISAPVARSTVLAPSSSVAPAADMVMCLSCHAAHGTANDYLLRFDYGEMTAGVYADLTAVDGDGNGGDGCLACHTKKGIIQ